MDTLQWFLELPQGNNIQAEYVWIGGNDSDLRCKSKTLVNCESVKGPESLPEWNFDGSSTNQAPGDNSEIWLRPVKVYPDPFRLGKNILVLCECLDPSDMSPIPSNKRAPANEIFNDEKVKNELPWYGIEQEYFLYDADNKTPLGWPKNGYPAPQGPYYCSVGASNAYGRDVVEAHYRACLYCGLSISGINAEVAPGQWEYQIGPVCGIDAADQLWISRYLLIRVAEKFNVSVRLDAKPKKGDWNGSGAHHNFSTLSMRQKGGYDVILNAIKKLETVHMDHMEVYGKTNRERLTGLHETAKYDEFSYGVANRGASIRIPRQTYIDRKGYLEDRRPAADVDPYESTSILARTTILT